MVFAVMTINVTATELERENVVKNYQQLKEKTSKGKILRVIVKLKDTTRPNLRSKSTAEREQLLQNNKQKLSAFKAYLNGHNIKYGKEFERLGIILLEINDVQLDALIDSDLVEGVEEDEEYFPTVKIKSIE